MYTKKVDRITETSGAIADIQKRFFFFFPYIQSVVSVKLQRGVYLDNNVNSNRQCYGTPFTYQKIIPQINLSIDFSDFLN